MRGISADLLRSYLSDRSQYVSIDQCISNVERINCGIPQGSVLVPILYNIYINDIVDTSDKFKYILFADETSILYCSDREDNASVVVNKELRCLHITL